MMKKHVKLSLTTRNVESLLTLANSVAGKMDGNAKFPAPPVVIADLKTAVAELNTVHTKAENSRSKIDFADERKSVAIVEGMLSLLGDYVEMIANGDDTIIFAAGMPASKTREKNPAPEQVKDFAGIFTGIPGTILIQWRRPQYAKYFRVYMSTDPGKNDWQLVDTISTRKLMVHNLTTGQKFYFKVVPVGTAGVGPDSEIAESIAA